MHNKDSVHKIGSPDGGLKDTLIMMVDDESINTDVVQIHLEDAGYTNFMVTDQSSDAMRLLKRDKPDVLLLDLMMPEVSGFDILAEMRREDILKDIPVIVLTSCTDAETKLRVLELGATDFLSKPVDPSELILRLRNTLTAKAYKDQLAYFDELTGLPNRQSFLSHMDWILKNAERNKQSVGIIHIGLDQFKKINDALGPKVGDLLLMEISKRIGTCLRSTDLMTRLTNFEQYGNLARFGGDEFSAILSGIDNADDIAFVASRILDAMKNSFTIADHELYISTSIGITTYPHDGHDPDTLMKNVVSATGHAKLQGRNNYQFYSNEINIRSTARLKMESNLRKALENNEFVLHYQPKIDPNSGRVAGMEALLRWNSPDYGMVYPDKFIPIAEKTRLIVPIGKWVLEEACRQTVEWQSQGMQTLSISVNVSIEQLQSGGFADTLKHAIQESGIDPGYLILEITESMVMNDTEAYINTLHELKKQGVDISIDDFGTGYSSLSYLTQFPVDELKIDRSFVTDIHKKEDSQAVGRAIIAMAQSLGLRIVAEGVEEIESLEFLIERGCDLIQGYYYSKPLSKEVFLKFVRSMNEKSNPVAPFKAPNQTMPK